MLNLFGTEPSRSRFPVLAPPEMALDLVENAKTFTASIDLPGFTKDQIKMDVTEDGVVSVSAERAQSKDEQQGAYHVKERSSCSVQRSFSLPENAKVNEANAVFENGVLSVTFPKKVEAKKAVKTIPIKSIKG